MKHIKAFEYFKVPEIFIKKKTSELKPKKVSFDKEIENKEDLLELIYETIDKFQQITLLEKKPKSVISWKGFFTEEFRSFIKKYGYKPTQINSNLIKSLLSLFKSLMNSNLIEKNEESKILYIDIKDLMQKIKEIYDYKI